jgi:membrane protein YqaA with SNARE-associated domain
MTTFWKWLAIIGMSMTPNLIIGNSIASYFVIRWHFDPWIAVPVMAVAGYVEGGIVGWLGGRSTNIGFVHRWIERMRKPKVLAFADKWGPWGGMTLGLALVGQEPILVALRWLGIEMKRIWLPMAVGNAISAILYYWLIKAGLLLAEPWW